MRPIYIQLLIIFSVWAVWFLNTGFSKVLQMVESHAVILLTMLIGSFVAGSTSLGGGAVAFPVFTKLLSIPSETALVFSLAIQSVGMSSAMLIIFLSKVPISKKIILASLFPGALGVYIGLFELNHFFAGGQAKYLFSLFSLFVAFVLIFDRFINHRKFRTLGHVDAIKDIGLVPTIIGSFIGGVINGLIGTGIDFVIFALMIIFSRVGLKRAVATSVCVMAINAVVGFVFILLISDKFDGIVVDYWLSAVPIVVFGAPLGALACRYFHRDIIFYFLMFLILMDVVSTAWIMNKHLHFIGVSVVAMGIFALWHRYRQKEV